MRRLDERESWLIRKLKAGNRVALDVAFRRPRLLMAMTLAGVVGAGALAVQLPR